ncbi:hypothetical protein HC928_15070 [bacterium]|nr:hypothetical protein [bacterium]
MTALTLVTHQHVDADAVVSMLLFEYALAQSDAEVVYQFVPLHWGSVTQYNTAVFDVGRIHDPDLWMFDHHQLPYPEQVSATRLVYNYVVKSDPRLVCLSEIVSIVDFADMNAPLIEPARTSHTHGFHAVLSGLKRSYPTDGGVVQALKPILFGMFANAADAHVSAQHVFRHIIASCGDVVLTDGGTKVTTNILIGTGQYNCVFFYTPETCGVYTNTLVYDAVKIAGALNLTHDTGWYIDPRRFVVMRRSGAENIPQAAFYDLYAFFVRTGGYSLCRTG